MHCARPVKLSEADRNTGIVPKLGKDRLKEFKIKRFMD
jgi:hypothetical protein